MTTPEVKERTLKIPIYKLEYYFPIGKSVETWMEHYSKILIEGYIHCLSDIPYTFVNQNYFQSHVYGKVIQIGMYGKYKTPYIAMMVGSKHRIWGMCIKVYEVTSASEHRVFIVNPYYELFNYLLTQNEKQRRETLLSQLSEGSVEKTYNLLKKRGWQNKTLLFTEYWSILWLIFPFSLLSMFVYNDIIFEEFKEIVKLFRSTIKKRNFKNNLKKIYLQKTE